MQCLTFLVATLSLAAAASDSLNFLVVGDWGGQNDSPYYTDGEKSVAAAMESKARKIGSQFVVGLGDNFYDYGVTDVEDTRFQETFEVSGALCRCMLMFLSEHFYW